MLIYLLNKKNLKKNIARELIDRGNHEFKCIKETYNKILYRSISKIEIRFTQ